MSNIPVGAIPVLDKGYVLLVGFSHYVNHSEDGTINLSPTDDLRAVADARVSTDKTATTFGPSEQRTLNFLLKEGHTSPFRGQVMTVEIKAPLFVARQFWKYCTGHHHDESPIGHDTFLNFSEVSRRYVDDTPEFYIPEYFRLAPERRSQGSIDEPAPFSRLFRESLKSRVLDGLADYKEAIGEGICAEQARLFLPAYAMYTKWRWTMSLQGFCHMESQRLPHDAQKETREYAKAIFDLGLPIWPIAVEKMVKVKEGKG